MTEPVSLNEFRFRHQVANSTALPFDVHHSDATRGNDAPLAPAEIQSHTDEYLSAQVLRKLDPDTELARFFDVITEAITELNETVQLLSSGHNIAADDKLMLAKHLFGEMFVLRDISDAVGVIALASLQAASGAVAITDTPNLPDVIVRALKRLWAAPYMSFDEAASIAHEIELAAHHEIPPGYSDLVEELIEAEVDMSPE